jgi:hypothetical protein
MSIATLCPSTCLHLVSICACILSPSNSVYLSLIVCHPPAPPPAPLLITNYLRSITNQTNPVTTHTRFHHNHFPRLDCALLLSPNQPYPSSPPTLTHLPLPHVLISPRTCLRAWCTDPTMPKKAFLPAADPFTHVSRADICPHISALM